MPSINDVYSSGEYLKAADLGGKAHKLTIFSATPKEFGQDDEAKQTKLVITFDGKNAALVCNKTNASIIAEQHGDDYTDWQGKTIILYPTKVDYAGKRVDAIRVKEVEPDLEVVEGDDEDDIPF